MNKIPIFAVTGEKETGKTTLICRLVERLKERGHNIASIKHTREDHRLDKEGGDSWRHGEAGSDLVIFSSFVETSFISKGDKNLERMIEITRCIDDYDIILVEGMRGKDIPHVDLSKEIDGAEYISDDLVEEVLERIEREIDTIDILNELPGSDCSDCGYDSCRGLAEAVNKGDAALGGCEHMRSPVLELKVNGEEVHLGGFPTKVIKNGIEGMIGSLKGVEEIRSVDIHIEEEI